MDPNQIPIPILEGHDCFACGTNNPIGLKLKFYRQGNFICSDVVLSRNHVGWQNMAHGGIISTLLDEIMSWTIIYLMKSFAVTRRMEIRYLRPVPVEVPLTVRGEMITSAKKGNTCQAKAVLLNGEGKKLARGSGEFAILSEEKLSIMPDDFRRDMLKLFRMYP